MTPEPTATGAQLSGMICANSFEYSKTGCNRGVPGNMYGFKGFIPASSKSLNDLSPATFHVLSSATIHGVFPGKQSDINSGSDSKTPLPSTKVLVCIPGGTGMVFSVIFTPFFAEFCSAHKTRPMAFQQEPTVFRRRQRTVNRGLGRVCRKSNRYPEAWSCLRGLCRG